MLYFSSMDAPAHFIPDRDPPAFYPLRGYLRTLPANVAAEYIAALTAPGDLVVDPFAQTPTVAGVAQRMGRRALAVESNPLWSWLTRVMATPPPPADINAALARLGDALKDGTPLRVHINQLYTTICANCREPTPADYFIHARDAGPVRRRYSCRGCGETRDDPASEDDSRRAAAFDSRGLHYHIAFDRVVPDQNLHAERIRKMLDLYTPRNLDALVTLTVKIDSLFRDPRDREILSLLLLHLLDRGTSFYASPDAAPELSVHKQFVEFNLWREIEAAARALATAPPGIGGEPAPATSDVLDSPEPRAFISRGSAKSLARAVPAGSAGLVLTALPHRRLALWALSYFWGAWTHGRAAVASLVASLDPHRNDPNWERRWYLESLVGSLEAMQGLLRVNGRAAFVFREGWQEVVEGLLLAASGARFELETLLFQPRADDFPRREFDGIRGDYRITMVKREILPLKILAEPQLAKKMHAAALDAGRAVLAQRGEPLAYSWIHLAAYSRLAREGYLAQVMSANTKVPPSRFVFYAVRDGLSEGYAHDLDHYETPGQFLWMRRVSSEQADTETAHNPPLVERVDDAVYEILRSRGTVARAELEDLIYRQFPAELTPEAGLIDLCAQTCAVAHEGEWRWRADEAKAEQRHALDMIARLGERLAYQVAATPPFHVAWMLDGVTAHGFLWSERPRLAELAQLQVAPTRGYLVVPEARIPLLRVQVRRLPLLANALAEAGWEYVRVPFVDQLLQAEKIERHDVMLITGLVPPVAGERTQLELF